MSRRPLLAATLIAGIMAAGVVVAQSQQDTPKEATPSADPIGDILKTTPPQPEPAAPPAPAPVVPPVVVVLPPTEAVASAPAEKEAEDAEDKEEEVAAAEVEPETPPTPSRRQRRPVAIVQAIDKITAETMRFEVEVGGRPVRFNRSLIFTARACEVSAPDELVDDSIAYLEVSIQPRGASGGEPRQIFKGWMFASSPGVSRLEHPIYDAWVVGCKA